jgi:hypothetical protein
MAGSSSCHPIPTTTTPGNSPNLLKGPAMRPRVVVVGAWRTPCYQSHSSGRYGLRGDGPLEFLGHARFRACSGYDRGIATEKDASGCSWDLVCMLNSGFRRYNAVCRKVVDWATGSPLAPAWFLTAALIVGGLAIATLRVPIPIRSSEGVNSVAPR